MSDSLPPSGTNLSSPNMDRCRDILEGYRHQDPPELAARRFPAGVVHANAVRLDASRIPPLANEGIDTTSAAVVAIVSRILGSYTSSTDILLALVDDKAALRVLRIQWDETRSWADLVHSIANSLHDISLPEASIPDLRDILGLNPNQAPYLATIEFSSTPTNSCRPGVPLSFSFDRTSLLLSIAASNTFLHPSVLDLLLSQIHALFEYALRDTTRKFSRLPDLPQDVLSVHEKLPLEERKALYDRIPHVRMMTDHLTRRAREDPDGVAVLWYPHVSPDETSWPFDSLTFLEWNCKANQLGRWLLGKGLQLEDRVAVCMERNTWFHIAFIGILRAGGCYVPIDSELPAERQRFIAEDSNARFIITSSKLLSFGLFRSNVLDIDDPAEKELILRETPDELQLAGPENLSYLLYTSGTTGTPKGCLLTHKGLVEAIWSIGDPPSRIVPENRDEGSYLSVASVAFDVHLAEIGVPLATGLRIIAAPRSLLLEDLPHYIKCLRVSHIGLVPSLIEATMVAVEDDPETFPLRYICSGGEKMSDTILDKWGDHPTVKLANFYGPSEVTIGCASRFMNRLTPRANIGRGFGSASSYIVDENMNIVLRGTPGELVVEGDLVGRGYLGRPDLTAKVFLEFPEKGKGYWAYRTGDLVRMMPDSTLEILGRIDTQIKLRGVRIESEGISSIVRNAALPDLTLDAVTVLARHPGIGTDQIVTFIAWDSSVPISTRKSIAPSPISPPSGILEKIKKACEHHLASYMRPSHIIALSWIPLSSNVKTDAKALAQLFTSLDVNVLTRVTKEDDTANEPPTDDEKSIITIVAEHLGIPADTVGPRTNLFECGLDSMGAIRLATKLRKEFGVALLSAADLMRDPTARGLAARIGRSSSEQETSSFVNQFSEIWEQEVTQALSSLQVDRVLPSFPLQEGVLSRAMEVRTMYVQHVLMELKPDTSLSRLRDAWDRVAREREILRTIFYFARDLVQVVLTAQDRRVSWSDKSTTVDEGIAFRDDFLRTDASNIATDINDHLSDIPPYRFTAYASEKKTFLVLSIQHSLFDGISLPVLLSNAEQAYLVQELPPSPSAGAVLDCIASIDMNKAHEHWTSMFAGYDWRKMMFRGTTESTAVTLSVPFKTTLSALQQKASQQKTTVQALLTASYGYLAATSIYAEDDIVFGVIRSGRLLPVESIEDAPYPLLSVTPTRVNFAQSENILQDIQHNISTSVDYEHVPLGRVAQWVRGGKMLFETLFSISYKDNASSSVWSPVASQNPEPEYILAVEVVLDTVTDSVLVHAAYTAKDIPPYIAEGIVQRLEETMLQFSEDDARERLLSVVLGSRTATPDSEGTDVEDEFNDQGPLDETMVATLRRTISDFLRVDAGLLTVDTSLVGLGLDSIRSVGLGRAIRTQGFQLSSVQLMKYSTIRRMINFLVAEKNGGPKAVTNGKSSKNSAFEQELASLQQSLDVESLKLTPTDSVRIYPTTTLQAGMLSQTVSSGGKRYFHVFPLRLNKDVEVSRVQESWYKISAAHHILRTSFHFLSDQGIWIQAVHSSSELKWSEGPIGSPEQYLSEFLSSKRWESGEGFFRPPLYLHLMSDSETGDKVLVVILHHALYDGITIGVLLDLVQRTYHEENHEAPAQFCDMLPHVLKEERHGTQFWLRRLRHLENVKEIPRRNNASEDISYVSLSAVDVDKAAVASIQRNAGVTVQAIAQVAFAKLLAVLTGSRDVVFGHVVSGRSIPGAEDVLGPMLNTIPSRIQFADSLKNLELVKSVHGGNVDALPWQHASLRAIHKALGVTQLWDSLFVFQPAQPSDIGYETIWKFDIDEDSDANIQYPLNIEIHETSTGFIAKGACSANVMDQAALKTALERYKEILLYLIGNGDHSCTEDISEVPAAPAIVPSKREPLPVVEGPHIDTNDEDFIKLRDILVAATKISQDLVKPGTHLISLGVDSITAIQIAGKYRRLGVRLRAEDILRSRTVSDVLRKIESSQSASTTVDQPTPTEANTSVSIPAIETSAIRARFGDETQAMIDEITIVSPGIKWLIGAWQRSDRTRFQHTFAYLLPSDVDVEKLRTAWISLLQRHAILRSTIATAPGSDEPRLVVFKPDSGLLASMWEEIMLQDAVSGKNEIEAFMKERVSSPPDLKTPVTRATLINVQESKYVVLYMNHFQYDAWSLQLLADDLNKLYASQAPSSSSALIPWLNATSPNDATLAEQKAYWDSTLPSSVRPSYFPALNEPASETTRLVYTNPSAIVDASKVQERARSEGLSPNAIFLAAWSKVQSEFSSSADSIFGLWHSGRSATFNQIERLALPCMNVLPLYVSKSGDKSVRELAHQIQDDLRARTPAVEQTDLVKLDEWVRGEGKALCNVYVNIVKVAPDVECSGSSQPLLTSVEIPYFIPNGTVVRDDFVSRLKVTDLVQDDIMIDIIALPDGAVLMSIESSENIMNMGQAESIVTRWAKLVQDCL